MILLSGRGSSGLTFAVKDRRRVGGGITRPAGFMGRDTEATNQGPVPRDLGVSPNVPALQFG